MRDCFWFCKILMIMIFLLFSCFCVFGFSIKKIYPYDLGNYVKYEDGLFVIYFIILGILIVLCVVRIGESICCCSQDNYLVKDLNLIINISIGLIITQVIGTAIFSVYNHKIYPSDVLSFTAGVCFILGILVFIGIIQVVARTLQYCSRSNIDVELNDL